MMDLAMQLLNMPMLAVLVAGLPVIVLQVIAGIRLLRVNGRRVRESTKRLAVIHFVLAAIPVIMTPFSHIVQIAVALCVIGAVVLAAGGIGLGVIDTRYHRARKLGVAEIVFGVLVLLVLVGVWWLIEVRMGIRLF